MKILANLEKMRMWSLSLAVLGMTMVSCSNILDEEMVDCSVEYRVKFKYDHNMKFADAFANEVRSVTLYSFDQDGNIVSGKQMPSDINSFSDNQKLNENILMQVLDNKVPFYSERSDKSYTLAEYCSKESARLEFEVTIIRYAFVDMDGDGIQEAVVDFQFGENSQVMCMVLKWDSISENVFGMAFNYRQMFQIKEDGSFAYSGGGAHDGWAKLRWENNSWVTLKVEDGDQKADVQWYSYPPALD